MGLFFDVSYAQSGAINFAQAKSSGRTDVYCKAVGGQVQTGMYVDSKYRLFEAAARAAGLGIGHYAFNGDAGSPQALANYLGSNVAGWNPNTDTYGLDVESNSPQTAWNPTKANLFADQAEQHFQKTGDIYLNLSLLKSADWSPIKNRGWRLWLAYPSATMPTGLPYWGQPDLWQYSIAAVPGAGSVDVDQTIGSNTFSGTSGGGTVAYAVASVIKDAQSATEYLESSLTGLRVGIQSVYHVSLLNRYMTGDPGMLVAEMDICASYFKPIGLVGLQPGQVVVASNAGGATPVIDYPTLAKNLAPALVPLLNIPTAAENGSAARHAIIVDPQPATTVEAPKIGSVN